MSKILRALICVSLCFSAAVIISGCAGGGARKAKDARFFIKTHHLDRLPKFDIPVEMNDRVVAWMEYFQGAGRGHFRRYLERSGRYVGLMQDILKKQGMPTDLIYLALIESGFNTQAYSRASAVGPWQFIGSTGRRYNLKQDGWVDERRDPYKSTLAASQYLKDLHNEFGDWYLAMAAYNAGEGRIRGAISQTGSRDFWKIADDRRALRPETRDYVPKFIAAAIMAKTPEEFGFTGIDYREPFEFDTATVETQTDFTVIAKCSGASEEDIFDLNPHLIGRATPSYENNYEIRLPKGTSKIFREKYASLPKEERIQVAKYKVRRGDTLVKVARRFGVSAKSIAQANNLSMKARRLQSGTTLTIPSGSRGRGQVYAEADDGSGSKKIRYTVKRGDTLKTIAGKYGVSVAQISAWNGLRGVKRINSGTRLVIKTGGGTSSRAQAKADVSSSKTQTHKVVRGETLSTIARRYGVSIMELKSLNGLVHEKDLQAGKTIAIRGVVKETEPVDLIAKNENEEEVSKLKEKIVSKKSVTLGEHKIAKGETISVIAKKYGLSTKELLSLNRIKNPKALKPGTMLIVKTTPAVAEKAKPVSEEKQMSEISSQAPTTSLSDLNISPVTKIQENSPNTVLAKTYLVKNGDTLWDIARKHGTSIAEIQKWNNLADPSSVKPGTSITIKK